MKKRIFFTALCITIAVAVRSQTTDKAVSQVKDPATIIISPQTPLSKKDTAFRTAISDWSTKELNKTNYKSVKAHPSAAIFPGAVRPGYQFLEKVVPVTHKKIADSLVPIVSKLDYSDQWADNLYSTGLYAVPGEYIEIVIPKNLALKDLKIQIGAHSDKLNAWVAGEEDWRRMPIIVKTQSVKPGIIRMTSPFGGLIYIAYPPKGESWSAAITIRHAIQAPFFIQGKTTPEEWKAQLAGNKAPWGELASEDVILTLPDSVLQKITDPDHVMKLWNLIIEGEMDLAQIPLPFYRAQRFVIDEHIGGGFMHSGYPIMVHHSPSRHMLSADIMANPALLMAPSRGGANWGFFHEMGHNMQNMDWVFGGTTEVSNNLFSLYMFDRLLQGRDDAHSDISSINTQKMMKKYFSQGASYEKWKSDPWIGLTTFRQLQEAFGWESFKAFFRQYHQLPFGTTEVPDQEKIDYFVSTFSNIVHQNIGPFFVKWGIPVSGGALDKLSRLPVWMPYNFPTVL